MERRTSFTWALLATGALASGCDPELRTENRQIRLTANVHSYDSYGSGRGIVEQSTVCAAYTGYRTSPDDPSGFTDASEGQGRSECFEERLSGPARFDEAGCVVLDTPAQVTWDFVRRPCALPDHVGDDRVRFDVLPLSAARGAFRHAVPQWTEALDFELEAAPGYPAGYVSAVGEPARVIEDGVGLIEALVVRADRPERVAVTEPTMTAQVLAGAPSFRIEEDPSMTLGVEARAGDAFQVGLSLPAGELDVGRVDVVSRDEIAAMTLHPVVIRIADSDFFLVAGAVAITRDREGRVLHGAPVQWSVLEGDHELVGSDRDEDGVRDPAPEVGIADVCEGASAGQARAVTLEGRIDGFRDTVRVAWVCVGEATEDGCACRSGAGRGWAGALGLLLLLGARARTRRARLTSARAGGGR
jgi:hypothetical protein